MIGSVSIATTMTWQQIALLLGTSFAFLFLPGFLLSGLALKQGSLSRPAQVAVSLTLSIGIAIILATVLLLANLPLAVLFWALAAVDIVAAGLLFLRRGKQIDHHPQPAESKEVNVILWIVFLAATVWLFYRFSLPVARIGSGMDFWSYVAYVRKWATWGERPAVDVLMGTPRARFRDFLGGWMLFQSLLSLVSKADPIDLCAWWMPPLLMMASYLALYSLAEALFRSANGAMLASLVYALSLAVPSESTDSIQYIIFRRIIEDKFLLTFLLLPIATLFMVRFLRDKRTGDLLLMVVMALACPLTHPLGVVELGLSFGFFAAFHFLLDRRRETFFRFVIIFAPLLLSLVIPLLERRLNPNPYTVDSPEAQVRFSRLHQGRLLLLDAARNRYIAHPGLLKPPLLLASLLLTPFLLFFVKKGEAARFLFSNTVGLLLLIYNPILTPLLGRVITPWMVWRLTYLLPFSLTLGFLLEQGMEAVERTLAKRGRYAPLAGFFPLLLLVVAVVTLWRFRALGWPRLSVARDYPSEADLLLNARRFIQEPARILAPRPFDTLVPAFLQHGFVPASRKTEIRLAEWDEITRFFEAEVITASMWDTSQRFGCSYLIAEKGRAALFWVSPLLSLLYQNSQYALFKIEAAPSDHPLVMANTYYAQEKWDLAADAYEQAREQWPLVSLLRLGQVRSNQGRVVEAEQAFMEARALADDNPWPHFLAAEFYRLRGNPETALEHYTRAFETWQTDVFFPASWAKGLEQVVSRGLPLLTGVPTDERRRWGVVILRTGSDVSRVDFRSLRIGWYSDWGVRYGPLVNPELGLEYAQTVMVGPGQFPPDWKLLERILDKFPGSIWLVGMWPEWEVLGKCTPTRYAEIYHEVYQFIKRRDVTAMVVPGGIMTPTPLRLKWLDAVLWAYESRYHRRLPADAWHINVHILREERGAWGASIPYGLGADTGQLYEIVDNADPALFRELVLAFRRWMAERGERGKPLFISGYGVQMPSDYLGNGDRRAGTIRVRDFMLETFEYLRTARDPELGYPADDNRLVQRWLWYSLNDYPYDYEAGTGSNGMLYVPGRPGVAPELTIFGRTFLDYMLLWGP